MILVPSQKEPSGPRMARKGRHKELCRRLLRVHDRTTSGHKQYRADAHFVSFSYEVFSAEVQYCLAFGEALNQIPITTFL